MPTDPSLDLDSFNRKDYSIILIEVGLCKNLGCHEKYIEKIEKCLTLLTALRHY